MNRLNCQRWRQVMLNHFRYNYFDVSYDRVLLIRYQTHIGLHSLGVVHRWNTKVRIASVRNFGCPCARDNQESRRTTKNTDAVVRRTIIKSVAKIYLCIRVHLYIPSTDNQKLGRTTRNLNLLVRGTTIYFSLIRTLIHTDLTLKELLQYLSTFCKYFNILDLSLCCFVVKRHK